MNPPRLISRYEVKGLIARGGMGDLYLARDPNTNRLVVVKLLSATLESTDIRERFEREARSLASLSHPNIVQIYDYGELDDTPFIVIEYVRGETLGERIKRRAPMSVALKLKLLAELCGGLAHAHGAGIIHRDVKPGNLMVDQDDRLKILDFGIARVADSSLTRFGVLASQVMQIGTPGYMSPEQVQGAEIDARSDVFAAGAVCYALLAYRDPFTGKNLDEIERSVMVSSPVPLTSLVPDLDPDVVSIVTRALAKSREQRYPDAATMGAALERCRQRLAQSETESRPAGQAKAGSAAETAYQRALALYEQGSPEAARRFSVEALAEDPNHAAARALLTRVQAERRTAHASPRQPTHAASAPATAAASRTPTTDDPTAPTVHIPAVQRPDTGVELEPTILMKPGQRPRPAAAAPTIVSPRTSQPPAPPDARTTVRANPPEWSGADPFATSGRTPEKTRAVSIDPEALFGPAARGPAPGTEETVLISPRAASRDVPPKPPAPRPPEKSSTTAPVNKRAQPTATSLWARLTSAVASWKSRVSPPPKRPSQGRARADQTLWKQYGLSVGIAAALLILIGGIALVAVWVFTPSGQLLTISRPVNGTIAGHGLRCGTAGADCSVTVRDGEIVELTQEPDAGYAFGGYTGDCAPVGRFAMSGPRACSATFELLPPAPVPQKTWTLTLVRPTDGTLMAAGKECGTMRSDCSVEVPDGVPVTVYATANPNYERSSFFGDCAPSGQMQMTGPRSCGATFVPRSTGPRTPKPPDKVVETKVPPVAPGPGPPPQTPSAVSNSQTGPVVVDSGKVAPAISDNDHAKTNEIPVLLKQYCAALESLDARKVQEVYRSTELNSTRRMFNQYKSLKCEMGEPKYLQLDGKAGTAQLEFGLKQIIQYQRGGAPDALEFIVTMTISRPEERTNWRIEKLQSIRKPKP